MTPVQQRFRAALELRELTIAMQRQRLVREHPAESDEEIDRRLRAWVVEPRNVESAASAREDDSKSEGR